MSDFEFDFEEFADRVEVCPPGQGEDVDIEMTGEPSPALNPETVIEAPVSEELPLQRRSKKGKSPAGVGSSHRPEDTRGHQKDRSARKHRRSKGKRVVGTIYSPGSRESDYASIGPEDVPLFRQQYDPEAPFRPEWSLRNKDSVMDGTKTAYDYVSHFPLPTDEEVLGQLPHDPFLLSSTQAFAIAMTHHSHMVRRYRGLTRQLEESGAARNELELEKNKAVEEYSELFNAYNEIEEERRALVEAKEKVELDFVASQEEVHRLSLELDEVKISRAKEFEHLSAQAVADFRHSQKYRDDMNRFARPAFEKGYSSAVGDIGDDHPDLALDKYSAAFSLQKRKQGSGGCPRSKVSLKPGSSHGSSQCSRPASRAPSKE